MFNCRIANTNWETGWGEVRWESVRPFPDGLFWRYLQWQHRCVREHSEKNVRKVWGKENNVWTSMSLRCPREMRRATDALVSRNGVSPSSEKWGYSNDHDGHIECLLFQKNMQNEQTTAEFLRRDRKGQRRTQYGSVEKPKAPGSPGLRDGPFQVLPSTPRKDSTQTQATATVSMTFYSHSQQVDKNILSRGWRDFSVAKITLLRPSLLRVCFGCLSHYGFWSFFHLH